MRTEPQPTDNNLSTANETTKPKYALETDGAVAVGSGALLGKENMTFTLHAPQIIMVILLAMQLIVCIVNHGEDRPPYNAAIGFLDVLIVVALLWWGGFFA